MLYYLLYPLRGVISGFNVFRYITFRTAWAALTALLISFILGPWLIERMRRIKLGQYIREEGPKSHQMKAGTPTMGGILINVAILIPTILWADLTNPYIWVVLFVTFAYAVIGFIDDYRKLVRKRNLGLTAKEKFAMQFGVALAAGLAVALLPSIHNNFSTVLTYAAGNFKIADYLRIAWVPQAGELAVFCGAMVGASLGFLWFNAHPAEIFMGDVGSLALGGAIGCLAVIIKQEVLLVLVGGLFVLEAASVIIQVASFKLTGRRVFKMSPLHHHFELSGWRETKVVVRFWIIAIIFALVSLSTLKLR